MSGKHTQTPICIKISIFYFDFDSNVEYIDRSGIDYVHQDVDDEFPNHL